MRSLVLASIWIALLIGAGVGLGVMNLDLARLHSTVAELGNISGDQKKSATAGRNDLEENAPRSEQIRAGADAVSDLARQLSSDDRPIRGQPSFDIARISPDGVSVFAGRAKPFEHVNIIVGEEFVGTASADGQGNWTLVTEKKIANVNAELKLRGGVPAPEDSDPVASAMTGSVSTPAGPRTVSVAAVNKQLFESLKGLVEEARTKNSKGRDEAPVTATAASQAQTPSPASNASRIGRPAVSATTNPAPPETNQLVKTETAALNETRANEVEAANAPDQPTSVGPAAKSSPQSSSRSSPVRVRTIPIPVQFIYREAEFSDEGREAVGLLLEYLLLSKAQNITLSGHADERGSDELNMELSRARLNAVRDILRAGGYSGGLELVAKGESEPFTGVDRSALPAEDLYQLDRRVELRLEN